MTLPTVQAARARMLACTPPPVARSVPLGQALGRVLAEHIDAERDQPPFPAATMDGWAVRRDDAADAARELLIVGESAAGRPWPRRLQPGQTVRISTGAPVPAGADTVVMQEEAVRTEDRVRLGPLAASPAYVRPAGCDFRRGARLLEAGARLTPWTVALAAAAGRATVLAARRPKVAVLTTGDELASPGAPASAHQIYDAAGPALAAAAELWGAGFSDALWAGDDADAIVPAVQALDADLLITVGGASVGDHDLVKPALRRLGLTLEVEGVAVRPGKPTWFGTLGSGLLVLGLPGNPASALVCAELFLRPLLARMQGEILEPTPVLVRLAGAVPANGPREHFLRSRVAPGADGELRAAAAPDQDSSLVTVLAAANALIRRAPRAPAAQAGDLVEVLLPGLAGVLPEPASS